MPAPRGNATDQHAGGSKQRWKPSDSAKRREDMQHGSLIEWLRTMECRLESERLGYQPISFDISHLVRRYSPHTSSAKPGESLENISPQAMGAIER